MSAAVRRGRTQTSVALSGCVVGLLIMGDSFLYGALPVSADALNLTMWQVSLLLSANRWVRLLSNSLVATLQSRWRMKPLFVGATTLALASSLAFTQVWSFPILLLARGAWGIAWSVFRQSAYVAVWSHPSERHGRLLGLWWGLVRWGSGLSVLLGGWLLDRTRFAMSMGAISAFAGVGIALGLTLAWPRPDAALAKEPDKGWTGLAEAVRCIGQSRPLQWLLGLGAGSRLILTLLVALASLHVQMRGGSVGEAMGLGLVTGLVLALHWLSQIVMGPVIGALSDILGRTRMLVILSVFLAGAIGLAGIAYGVAALALAGAYMLLFSGLRVVIEASASDEARLTARPREVMGFFTTLDDLAAAWGPILGLAWFQASHLTMLFEGSAALLLVLASGLVWSQTRLRQPLANS